MKLLVDNVVLDPGDTIERIRDILIKRFGVDCPYSIERKSLDARKKKEIVYRYRVVIEVPDDRAAALLAHKDISLYTRKEFPAPARVRHPVTVHIAGTGPAGLFCGLRLIRAGARVEIFERGKPIEERMKDIEVLELQGILDERSNVLYGEGGAGTYSDGKLTTRIRKPEIDWLFGTLVDCGAPSTILYEAKPHLGTDRLRGIVKRIREEILSSGSQINFNESIDDLIISDGSLAGFVTSKGREIVSSRLVLAIGHSARDTYAMLERQGVRLEKKGFAMGIRIEHPAELIDDIQYGKSRYRDRLPVADYMLTYANRATGRGVYSFCMCPGGRVINSSSEQGRLCTNGMSFSKRDHPFSNAAIVVTVTPEDFSDMVLGGILFQRDIEQAAYDAGGGMFTAPAQRVTSFLQGKADTELPPASYRPGVFPAGLDRLFPAWLVDELKEGIRQFDRKMKGFASEQALLIGVETRTSSPVRITRGPDGQSVGVRGLYPVGEGAGYAGGIVSSAVDGIRCADCIIEESND
ncbi:MAG: hypothetical protein JXA07_00365 [Spirochaetes bacterium]|nr:hypothetical protein [Spirochaetota bacterium]